MPALPEEIEMGLEHGIRLIADFGFTGTSSSSSNKLPQEEVRSHKSTASKEEAEIDGHALRSPMPAVEMDGSSPITHATSFLA